MTEGLGPDQRVVLAYFERERKREQGMYVPENAPLGGLSLDAFRLARSRLAERGLLVQSRDGRWRLPVPGEAPSERAA